MSNLFNTPEMAMGYARARPAVHSRIVALATQALGSSGPVADALDVGCGAGLSTRALQSIAKQCWGIDPSPAMIACASQLVTGAKFQFGMAEALPFPAASMDLIAAAGSLNYVDLGRFFPEARRVLKKGGALFIYDFSQGRISPEAPNLERWFTEFLKYYPLPAGSARELSVEILRSLDSGLTWHSGRSCEIGLRLSADPYLDYVMTETNVAHAIQCGKDAQDVRRWIAETLSPIFSGQSREIRFPAYYAILVKEC